MSCRSPGPLGRLLLATLLAFSPSCSLLLKSGDNVAVPPDGGFSGYRVYTNPDTGREDFWIRLDQKLDEAGVEIEGALTGCLAARQKPNRVDFVTVTAELVATSDGDQAIITAPEEEGSTNEVQILAVRATGGAVQFSSPHEPYDIPEPLTVSEPQLTCESLEVLLGDSKQVVSLGTAGGISPLISETHTTLIRDVATETPVAADRRGIHAFGTYCQPDPIEGVPKGQGGVLRVFSLVEEVCADLEKTTLELRHINGRQHGSLYGVGSFELDDQSATFATAGRIESLGVATLAVQLPGFAGRFSGDRNARLISSVSPDRGIDDKLMSAYNETLVLGKQACGNRAPRVTLTSEGGNSLEWGQSHCFTGEVDSDEDTAFPPRRLRMASSIDGEFAAPDANISSAGPLEIIRCTTGLSPGAHEVSFTAVDSGGLRAWAKVEVEVTNRAPLAPIVVQPRSDDTIVAGGDIIFEGKAFDYEEGMLSGGSLTWSASRDGGAFFWIGTGPRLAADLAETGAWTVRLTATDGAGDSTERTAQINVLPFAGNTTPRVTIEVPPHLSVPGRFGGSFPPGEVVFRGTVDDTEDANQDLVLRWDARPVQPAGPALAPILNSTLAVFPLTAGSNRQVYEIVFRATDRGGLEGKKVIQVLVVPD